MDFGNPKELRFFNDLRLISGFEGFGRGGEGGHIVTDFVTRVMRPKYLLKKSDRRCALLHLANKKYDSVSFTIRITLKKSQFFKITKVNLLFNCIITSVC